LKERGFRLRRKCSKISGGYKPAHPVFVIPTPTAEESCSFTTASVVQTRRVHRAFRYRDSSAAFGVGM